MLNQETKRSNTSNRTKVNDARKCEHDLRYNECARTLKEQNKHRAKTLESPVVFARPIVVAGTDVNGATVAAIIDIRLKRHTTLESMMAWLNRVLICNKLSLNRQYSSEAWMPTNNWHYYHTTFELTPRQCTVSTKMLEKGNSTRVNVEVECIFLIVICSC